MTMTMIKKLGWGLLRAAAVLVCLALVAMALLAFCYPVYGQSVSLSGGAQVSGSGPTGATGASGANGTNGQVLYTDVQNLTTVYGADSGTANTYVVTPTHAPSSLTAPLMVIFKVGNANTGASTLNINGLGAKPLTKNGTAALVLGDLLAGQIVTAVYDGTEFQLQGGAGGSGSSSSGCGVGYAHYTILTVPSGQVTATETGFIATVAFNVTFGNGAVAPTLTNLAATSSGGQVSNGQNDIIFCTNTSGGTQLAHDVLVWTGATGAFVANTQLMPTTAGTSTAIVMFWGNSSASSTQQPATLYSGYGSVHHLITLLDSAGNGNTLTTNAGPSTASGMFGGGYTLNGTTQYLNRTATLTGLPSGSTSRSMDVWFKMSSLATCNSPLGYGVNATGQRVELGHCQTGTYLFADPNIASNDTKSTWAGDTTTWHKLTWNMAGSNMSSATLYLDGVALTNLDGGATALNTTLSGGELTMGKGPGFAGDYFHGTISEARIGPSHDAGWIAMEYANQSAPATFWSVGTIH